MHGSREWEKVFDYSSIDVLKLSFYIAAGILIPPRLTYLCLCRKYFRRENTPANNAIE